MFQAALSFTSAVVEDVLDLLECFNLLVSDSYLVRTS